MSIADEVARREARDGAAEAAERVFLEWVVAEFRRDAEGGEGADAA